MNNIAVFKLILSLICGLFLFKAEKAHAYPNFIGYGYTTCAVCHFNTLGNGPLTDYGRALFAQEIAARPFIPPSVSDEKLAENSGFIPGVQLPYWIRPSLKARGIWVDNAPRGSEIKQKWINMQQDVNLVLSLDPEFRTILSATWGLLPEKKDYYGQGKEDSGISREHYIRTYFGEHFLVALGLMDKVYGIRTADHTAASRSSINMGQDDQVHGVVLEYAPDQYLGSLHVFQGNLMRKKEERQAGFSGLFEYEIAEKNRAGISFAQFENEYTLYRRAALHDRWGLPKLQGSSFLIEAGLKEDRNKSEVSTQQRIGTYGFIETDILLTRGYHFISTFERIQNEIKVSSLDLQRWSLGFLTFPFQRTEFRFFYIQQKGFSSETAFKDRHQLQGQVHVSL